MKTANKLLTTAIRRKTGNKVATTRDRASEAVQTVTDPQQTPAEAPAVVSPLDALDRLNEIVADRPDALALTNKALAELVGCDPRTVKRWRRLRRRMARGRDEWTQQAARVADSAAGVARASAEHKRASARADEARAKRYRAGG